MHTAQALETREYGKKEFYLKLVKLGRIKIGYQTFSLRLTSELGYSGPDLEDFNRRRVLKPTEVKLFMAGYFGEEG